MKSGLFAASLVGMSLFIAPLLPVLTPAQAADNSVAAYDDADQGRFVRIGLNKSAVVKLPGEARDVVIGNPGIVDAVIRTKNTAYLFAREVGQTNIFFFDGEGQQILALDLEVAMDTTAIRKVLNRTLPGNRISVDTAADNVVLGGTARNAGEVKTAVDLAAKFSGGDATKVINTMTVEGEDQVMLKVKVVEVQRKVLKQFGIDLKALLSAGKFAFDFTTAGFGAAASGTSLGGSFSSGGFGIDGIIRALEGDGLVRTLAEPNLTALTGEAASFHAGGEFPYRLCTSTTAAAGYTCSIEFKEYGVNVDFTPTVISEDRINLKIKTNVSEIGDIVYDGIPSINNRSTETALEMPSGGSMMIAGLISENTRHSIDATPGLKKLPVLGALFRSHEFQTEETELVVIVTPVLVRPTTQGKLTSPDKGYNPPTDRQAVFLGRMNKVVSGSDATPDGTYHGNVGFIVE